MVQKDKNLYQIINFLCPYDGRIDTKELEENESQGCTSSVRCPGNNIHKIKKLVTGNRY